MKTKVRLTITLSKDVLGKLDSTIDKKDIRNRSHAIEQILYRNLTPRINTALILAGKKSGLIPPPLTRIEGRTLFSLMIEFLRRSGISKVVVCGGYSGEMLKKEFGNGNRMGVRMNYVQEPEMLGTAGAIKNARRFLNNGSFLVIHGDVFSNINIDDFIKFHSQEKNVATIAVKPRLFEKEYGRVILQGNKITKFITEKSGEGISIVNTGIYLFEPDIFDYFAPKKYLTLEKDVFPKLVDKGKLSAYLFQGYWYDISRKENLKEAREKRKEIIEKHLSF